MPILHAELQLLGRQVPCATASFSFHQATDYEGRPSSTVHNGLLEVVLTGQAACLSIWPELKLDPFRRVSGHLIFFKGTGQTAKRYTFYNAALVYYDCQLEARGQHGQAALVTTLHFSAPTVEVQGQRVETYSVIPWRTDSATSFRALTKLPEPQPWAGLGVVVRESLLKAEQLASGLVKKVITPAGELGTELLGVSAAAVARVASLTAGILLTPTNSRDDPGYAAEWEMYHRNHQPPLFPSLTPAQLRLAQLERLYEHGTLTPEEEAELIALLAKVKGIHINQLADLPGPKTNGRVALPIFTPLLPGEGEVGTYKELLDAGSRGDNITPHHVPSDAYIKQHGVAKNDGVCINMEQPQNGGRHRRTKTFGRNMTDAEREAYYKLPPKEALDYDIQNVREIFREEGKLDTKMEKKLQEVLNQNKTKFPKLYGH
ncbi:type VI secretion system tube protein TssD [Hymenobacter terrenus]|uniref:type VI secretion system tube protein TssD n=1 Tax=Hymenobacter terrenus TaxID=1629124 RepID=UPI0012E0C24F|nr:type VI secretion system tube protein TssD [Hymenobacter terrenus]